MADEMLGPVVRMPTEQELSRCRGEATKLIADLRRRKIGTQDALNALVMATSHLLVTHANGALEQAIEATIDGLRKNCAIVQRQKTGASLS